MTLAQSKRVGVWAHGVHGNRGSLWPKPWASLAEAYGGNVALASALGVTYQTLYRYVLRGEAIPQSMKILIGVLAAQKNLANPAIEA